MIYKFKSKATGDVLMLGPNGDQMLRLIGRELAAKGIIEPAHMPAVIESLQAAVVADDASRVGQPAGDDTGTDAARADTPSGLPLRQRLWPLVEMLRRAHAAGEPVVWGV